MVQATHVRATLQYLDKKPCRRLRMITLGWYVRFVAHSMPWLSTSSSATATLFELDMHCSLLAQSILYCT